MDCGSCVLCHLDENLKGLEPRTAPAAESSTPGS
jgi:hypothetical protein